ncbi:hypothetical protein RB195_009962 [Necator americanus]|uniref:Endonuclease/exonuclease/phosphatase domain-containing protein n=1 Tax=Necator americanus TaxID=51031 RepID=A0ABR1CZ07_NECAM
MYVSDCVPLYSTVCSGPLETSDILGRNETAIDAKSRGSWAGSLIYSLKQEILENPHIAESYVKHETTLLSSWSEHDPILCVLKKFSVREHFAANKAMGNAKR